MAHAVRDLNERQSQLFVLAMSVLASYRSPELQPLIDDDVAEAMGALAATYETASRGLIYEHRPTSFPADRLAAALKPIMAEAGQRGGTAFERDAGIVLRRVEEAARAVRSADPGNTHAFLDLVGRIIRRRDEPGEPDAPPPDAPRLILP